ALRLFRETAPGARAGVAVEVGHVVCADVTPLESHGEVRKHLACDEVAVVLEPLNRNVGQLRLDITICRGRTGHSDTAPFGLSQGRRSGSNEGDVIKLSCGSTSLSGEGVQLLRLALALAHALATVAFSLAIAVLGDGNKAGRDIDDEAED